MRLTKGNYLALSKPRCCIGIHLRPRNMQTYKEYTWKLIFFQEFTKCEFLDESLITFYCADISTFFSTSFRCFCNIGVKARMSFQRAKMLRIFQSKLPLCPLHAGLLRLTRKPPGISIAFLHPQRIRKELDSKGDRGYKDKI